MTIFDCAKHLAEAEIAQELTSQALCMQQMVCNDVRNILRGLPPMFAWPAPRKRTVCSFRGGTPVSFSAPRKLATIAAAVLSLSSLKVLTPCTNKHHVSYRVLLTPP